MTNDALAILRREAFAAVRPPARVDLVSWIERNVRLPATVAAESGPMRLFPWQIEVARSIENPAVERVTIQKSARIGATQLMVAGIGHFALNDPALQLVVMPSESDVRMLTTDVIEKTFEASPALRNALLEDVSGRDTMLSRHYPGGRLSLVSGASPKNLRARTARVLWLDEVDGLDVSAGEEGDPVALAIRRTMTFGTSRKIVMMSTPLDEETSRIARAYSEGDCRVWELPCAHCGAWHELTWAMIRWPDDQPERAHFVCLSCGCITEESGKAAMIARGRWRATRPEVTEHHSYRLSTFGASTLAAASWGALAVEFVKAHRDPHLLKTWVNTVAGETWKEDAPEALHEDDLASHAVPIGLEPAVPEGALILTAGADVQHDRIELTVTGHGEDSRMWILSHRIFWGNVVDPHDPCWADLDEFLRSRFRHELGGMIEVSAAAIDAGDGQTMQTVMGWAAPRLRSRIIAVKGIAGNRPVIERAQRSKHRAPLWLAGVDTIKSALFSRSRAGLILFAADLGPEWFAQFVSERRVLRTSRGQPVHAWERIPGRRAESLDCCTYAVAARQLLHPDWDRRRLELAGQTGAAPPLRPVVVASEWMTRGR